MSSFGVPGGVNRQTHLVAATGSAEGSMSPQHFLLALLHRKWLAIGIFVLVSAGTATVSYLMPNVYSSETVIMVDPQQVPGAYVQPTVTGNIRNRLGTLSEQILSATRLQRIIDSFNLYQKERAKLAREDVINLMRSDINVEVVNNPNSGRDTQDFQAFKISYMGKDPRTVAQVANELASLFIEENLENREQIATGTSDFLKSELDETRKNLDVLENKIRDFKMAHLGEMPEQQQSNIEMLGQLQTRLQEASDSLDHLQQQKSYLQTLAAATESSFAPRQDNAQGSFPARPATAASSGPTPSELKLADLLSRYGENHPDVKRLRLQIEEERKEKEKAERAAKAAPTPAPAHPAPEATPQAAQNVIEPTIKAQLAEINAQIPQRKEDQQKLLQMIDTYQKRLEAEPMREQEISGLVRDYAISKEHYSSLLEKQLSAEMATQLEIRQKGEKFTILDPAQIPQKPTSPNRAKINLAGSAGGLALGLGAALAPELLSPTIILPSQIGMSAGLALLGVIPVVVTPYDRRRRKRLRLAGTVAGVAMVLLAGAFLVYHFYRDQLF